MARWGRTTATIAILLAQIPGTDTLHAQQEEDEVELTPEELEALREAVGEDTAAAPEAPAPIGGIGAVVASMNPDISLILDVAAAYFTAEPLQLGAHDPNRTGVTLQQLEMHLESSVDPYFELQANLVFSLFGVEVEEAYAATLALPYNLQLRAGQFLTRFGRLNPTHPHSWKFVDQPLVLGKFFGPEGSRGLGAELGWLVPLPWFAELIGSATMADGACCARSFFGGRDLGVEGPQDLLYTVALKQFFPLGPSWSLLWGLSGQFGPNPSGPHNRTEIYGTDLYLRLRPVTSPVRASLSLQAEAMLRRRQIPGAVLQDVGGYAQLVWQPHFQWELGLRYGAVSAASGGPDDLDPQWIAPRQRASLQGTWYPSHFSRLRLQGTFDDPQWRERPIWAVMLALEVLIGAHGAHDF